MESNYDIFLAVLKVLFELFGDEIIAAFESVFMEYGIWVTYMRII